jgi:hypothetical protein
MQQGDLHKFSFQRGICKGSESYRQYEYTEGEADLSIPSMMTSALTKNLYFVNDLLALEGYSYERKQSLD